MPIRSQSKDFNLPILILPIERFKTLPVYQEMLPHINFWNFAPAKRVLNELLGVRDTAGASCRQSSVRKVG